MAERTPEPDDLGADLDPGADHDPGADDDKHVDLEADSHAQPPEPAKGDKKPDAYGLHAHDDDPSPPSRPVSPKELDVCGNCGAPMSGPDTLVCMRCGYDMKQMKVIEIEESEEIIEPEEQGDSKLPSLSRAGRGDQWLPAALAAGALVLLIVAHLTGMRGLFPSVAAEEAISFGTRLTGAGRIVIFAMLTVMCGVGGLVALAAILGTSLGDVRLAVLRIAAIGVCMLLVKLIVLNSAFLEFVTQAILAIGIVIGLTIGLFAMTLRDAVTFALGSLGAFLLLWLVGAAANWVI